MTVPPDRPDPDAPQPQPHPQTWEQPAQQPWGQPDVQWELDVPRGAEPTGPVGRRRRVVVAVVASVLIGAMLLAAGLGTVFVAVQNRTSDALLDQVSASEGAMRDLQEDYVAAGEDAEAQRQAGADAVPQLQRARERVDDVRILPWEGSLTRARDLYLDHVDAWIAAAESIAQTGRIANGDEIDLTFRVACDALRDSAPPLGGADDRARVDRLCAEDEPADDGGGPSIQV